MITWKNQGSDSPEKKYCCLGNWAKIKKLWKLKIIGMKK